MFKTILTGFILGIILILFIPSGLILASWNAVPGDSTYSIKVGLEKAILGITPSDNLKTTLEIKYTERRFSEVEKLINTNTSKTTKTSNSKLVNTSLANLTNQAIASKNSLQKIQNKEEKTVQTENLIATLEAISLKMEEKKQDLNTNDEPTKTTQAPTKKPSPTPTKNDDQESIPIQTSIVLTSTPAPTATSIPTPTPTIVSGRDGDPDPEENLGDTQEVINEIIDELKGDGYTEPDSTTTTNETNRSILKGESNKSIKTNTTKKNIKPKDRQDSNQDKM